MFRKRHQPNINPLIAQKARIFEPVAEPAPSAAPGVVDPELAELRASIQHRGQADIVGAAALVENYLGAILHDAGAAGNAAVRRWAADRMRQYITIGGMGFFAVLEKLPDEVPPLRAEYLMLLADPIAFGPEHLIAWWWLLQPSLFKPAVEAQLRQMHDALRDGVAVVAGKGGPANDDFVDWRTLIDGLQN